MPQYTIETAYHLPVYRQRTYEAPTPEAACALAVEDEGWSDGEEDVEASGETYVAGIWEGQRAYSGPGMDVPEQFAEAVQRKADLFEDLVQLLKEPARPMGLSAHDFERWLPRALAALEKADAILSDTNGGK